MSWVVGDNHERVARINMPWQRHLGCRLKRPGRPIISDDHWRRNVPTTSIINGIQVEFTQQIPRGDLLTHTHRNPEMLTAQLPRFNTNMDEDRDLRSGLRTPSTVRVERLDRVRIPKRINGHHRAGHGCVQAALVRLHRVAFAHQAAGEIIIRHVR